MLASRTLRWLVFCCVLFGVGSLPAGAVTHDPANYPLRVHIFGTGWNGVGNGEFAGYGKANLIDGEHVNALDFTYRCDVRLISSEKNEVTFARWKKPGKSIEILAGVIGNADKARACELQVTLKDYAYDPVIGPSQTRTPEEYRVVLARELLLHPKDTNYDHYPLQLTLLHTDKYERVNGMFVIPGKGNLMFEAGPKGIDFNLTCPVTLTPTGEGRFLAGRWDKPGSDMTLIFHRNSDLVTIASCTLQVVKREGKADDVYLRTAPNVVKSVSAEDYVHGYADSVKPLEEPY